MIQACASVKLVAMKEKYVGDMPSRERRMPCITGYFLFTRNEKIKAAMENPSMR